MSLYSDDLFPDEKLKTCGGFKLWIKFCQCSLVASFRTKKEEKSKSPMHVTQTTGSKIWM